MTNHPWLHSGHGNEAAPVQFALKKQNFTGRLKWLKIDSSKGVRGNKRIFDNVSICPRQLNLREIFQAPQ